MVLKQVLPGLSFFADQGAGSAWAHRQPTSNMPRVISNFSVRFENFSVRFEPNLKSHLTEGDVCTKKDFLLNPFL